jgi:uncharacterized protein YbjT (DUF2867 family)
MASSSLNVIVFGAAGAVGCAASREAHRRGASVWLAMRDTSKPILDLDSSEPGYTRIQADLSEPSSVAQAIQQSSATIAFVYTVFASQDHMASAFATLKSAGIVYVVLLSSFSVRGAAHEASNTGNFIASVHAKTEVALKEAKIAFAAIRPGYFNSNVFWNREDIKNGEAGLLYPEVKFDFIAPEDIGTVCGAILAEPRFQLPDEGQHSKTVFLCGPELMTQRHAYGIISQTINREIEIKELSEEAWMEKLSYMPKPALDALLNGLRASQKGYDSYPKDFYEEAVANVKKYKEAEPMTFKEWVEAHKAAFV